MVPRLRAVSFLFFALLAAASADAAGVVQGIVTSAAGGARLPGKIVSAWDLTGALRGTASTDAAGMYTLTLPDGGYRLLAYDPAGELATVFYGGADSFETTPVVQVAQGAPLQAHFALPRGGTVSGTVGAASAALGGAVVEAYNLSGTRRGFTTANAAGDYSLVLPAGDYKLFAYDPNGFYAGEFHQNVRAFADAAPVRVNPPDDTRVSFVLEGAARAGGVVRDADTGAGAGSILVYAYTAAGSQVAVTTTSADGAFLFRLGPGQYRFVAADPGGNYGPAFHPGGRSFEGAAVVTLSSGQEANGLDFAVERAAQIRGRVPAGLTVIAYNLDGTQHASARADANGDYVLVVAAGDYRLAVVDPAGLYATQFHAHSASFATANDIAILAGQTLNGIHFNPPHAGRFTGTVRDAATSQPLAGKVVVAYDAAGSPVAQTTTAAGGTYTLAVIPGQYRLLAFDPAVQYATAYAGGATSYDATLPLGAGADGTTPADFIMHRGVRVTGTVELAGGAALTGVEIFAVDLQGNRVAAATASQGVFELALLPGTYRFRAVDPWARYLTEQYSGGAPVTIGSTSPSPLHFVLDPVKRRRVARH